jgi:hypothetical protein
MRELNVRTDFMIEWQTIRVLLEERSAREGKALYEIIVQLFRFNFKNRIQPCLVNVQLNQFSASQLAADHCVHNSNANNTVLKNR